MGGKRLTREDLEFFKRRRKKQIRNLAIFISLVVLAVAGVSAGLIMYFTDDEPMGREMKPDIETLADSQATENMSTVTDASPSDSLEAEHARYEFTVPDTELPPVEEVTGENWFDESKYVKNTDVPEDISYFDNTIFIGDSRTEGIVLYSGLPNINGFCYKGLSVDKLESDRNISIPGVSGRFSCLEAVRATKYDNYYCMFGVNELGWYNLDVFVTDFEKLIDTIKEANPDAMVYVESILPVTEKISAENDIYKQDRVLEFNSRLLEMCQRRGDVIYLDVASAVMNEQGYLPQEASTDGVHCNQAYCKRVIQYIRLNTYSAK